MWVAPAWKRIEINLSGGNSEKKIGLVAVWENGKNGKLEMS